MTERSIIPVMLVCAKIMGAGDLLVSGVDHYSVNLKCHLLRVNLVEVVLANNHSHLTGISRTTESFFRSNFSVVIVSNLKQWPAVRTCVSDIKDPPHWWLYLPLSLIWKNYCLNSFLS